MSHSIHGMPLRPLEFPEVVTLYPRDKSRAFIDVRPVFALMWVPAGLLCQHRALVTDTQLRQTFYQIVTWKELEDLVIVTQDTL